MKARWFKRSGWFYLPCSVPGTLIAIAAIGFCVNVFLAIDRHAHSVSDTLYGIFPYFASVFLLFTWIASNTSNEND